MSQNNNNGNNKQNKNLVNSSISSQPTNKTLMDLEKAQKLIEEAKTQKENLEKQQHAMTQEISLKQRDVANVEIDKEIMDITSNINRIKVAALKEQGNIEIQISEAEKEAIALENKNDATREKIKAKSNALNELKIKLEELEVEIAKSMEEIAEEKSNVLETGINIDNLKTTIATRQVEITNIIEATEVTVQNEQNKIDELQEKKRK